MWLCCARKPKYFDRHFWKAKNILHNPNHLVSRPIILFSRDIGSFMMVKIPKICIFCFWAEFWLNHFKMLWIGLSIMWKHKTWDIYSEFQWDFSNVRQNGVSLIFYELFVVKVGILLILGPSVNCCGFVARESQIIFTGIFEKLKTFYTALTL